MKKLIGAFCLLFLMASTLNAQNFIKLKNRWKKDGRTDYRAHIQNATVDAGATQSGWWSAQWEVEKVPGTEFVRFKNRWKKDGRTTYYLHNQNGRLAAGAIQPGWWSAQWKLIKVSGTNFYRIQNRWKPNEHLHIQGAKLASGAIQSGWWSAMWELEGYRGTPSQPTNNTTANNTTSNKPRLMSRPISGVGFGAVPTSANDLRPVRKVKRVTRPAAGIGSSASSARKVFTLDMPPVGNQGVEGSCVAWTCGYAMKSFEMKRATGTDYKLLGTDAMALHGVVSPEYLFNRINLNNDNCGIGSFFVGDDKNRGALDVLKTEGAVTWLEAPYSDKNGCGTVDNHKEPVSPNAAKNRIKNYAYINDLSPASLKTLLLDQHPIGFYAYPSDEFMSAGAGYIWKSGEGPVSSAHAMTIIGYDDTKNAYRVQNSWGTNWGDNGYFWLDYDFAKTAIKGAYVTYTDNLKDFNVDVPGFVTVYSEAGYVAWCKLTYTLSNGQKKKFEKDISLFFSFKHVIPPGATNITLEVGGYAVLDGLDFKKTWNNSNVQQCYKIWGTIFDTEYGSITCAY